MSNCSQNCTNFSSIGNRAIPKSTLSQHFKALREAGLIRSERMGVEMRNVSRCDEIDQRFPGLLAAVLKAYTEQLTAQQSAGKAARRKAARRVTK